MGYQHVLVLKGGWNGWLKAGLPVEKKMQDAGRP